MQSVNVMITAVDVHKFPNPSLISFKIKQYFEPFSKKAGHIF